MKTPPLLLIVLSCATAAASNAEAPLAPASAGREGPAQAPSTQSPVLYPTAESVKTLFQPYLPNLESYEPMYFLVGAHPRDSKFQVSLKYRLLSEKGSLARRHPWVTGFHLGYTQTSFWDLESTSVPFLDTSYKPELFFLSDSIDTGIPHAKGFFVQTGIQHESNGRDGDASRSTNFLYVRPRCVFYNETNKVGLLVSSKIWAYAMNDRETNPDLPAYRGHFELEIKVGMADDLVLGTTFRWARKGPSTQWDLTYPMHKWFSGNLDLYLQVQYVDGLAEGLLDYRERTEALRIGVALVR